MLLGMHPDARGEEWLRQRRRGAEEIRKGFRVEKRRAMEFRVSLERNGRELKLMLFSILALILSLFKLRRRIITILLLLIIGTCHLHNGQSHAWSGMGCVSSII
jgi:hypothetical protein